MNKILNARIEVLDTQLSHAVVEQVGDDTNDVGSYDEGTYKVFVPGAVREWNIVSAESEEEAIEKVRNVLCVKLKQMDAAPKEDVTIDPDNVKVSNGMEGA